MLQCCLSNKHNWLLLRCYKGNKRAHSGTVFKVFMQIHSNGKNKKQNDLDPTTWFKTYCLRHKTQSHAHLLVRLHPREATLRGKRGNENKLNLTGDHPQPKESASRASSAGVGRRTPL